MDTPIRHYRLLPSALPAAQKRVVNLNVLPQITVLAVVMLISLLLLMRASENREAPIALAVLIALFLTYLAFVPARRARRRLAHCWATYVLEIGPDYLLRQQADTPDIRLQFQEIKTVERRPGQYLRVVGVRKYHVIGIPESIENFPEVLQRISGLAPLTPPRANRNIRSIALTAFGFAVWMAMLWSKSPWVVLPLAALLAGLLIWLFVFIQRSPNVSLRSKRLGWLYLGFVPLVGLKVLEVVGRTLRH